MRYLDFRNLRMICLGLGLGVTAALPAAAQKTTVVIFFIDGLMPESAKLMAANGAAGLKLIHDSGVVAEASYTPYPKEGYTIENGTRPWGQTSPGNVAVHNGCHVFETKKVDDIFIAAKEKGIKSVYAGGSANYSEITTSDFHYAGELSDQVVVGHAITHLKNDKVRLIRLHPQRVRDAWNGPAGIPNAKSAYSLAIAKADAEFMKLVAALKAEGVWDSTYVIYAADHGMNDNAISLHDADQLTSWTPFIGFYGPGLKKGATIPYAELSDLAIMTNHFLGLRPLKGVTDPLVTILPKSPTGSFLANLYQGAPRELPHPRYIERFLEAVAQKPKADYISYRNAMLPILKAHAPVSLDGTPRRAFGREERFAITASGSGLRIEAPWEIDRVDWIGADGRARAFAVAPPARDRVLPRRLPSGAAALRLGRAGAAETRLIAARP